MKSTTCNQKLCKIRINDKSWGFFVFLSLIIGFYLTSLFFIDQAHTVTDVPTIITYQGKLFESSTAVTTTQSMSFVIYDASSGGNVVYTASGTIAAPTATKLSITPDNGIFSIDLGVTTTAPITNSLDPSIFKNNSSLYLEVLVGAQTLSPRKRLTTSPFSFNSQYLMGVAATSTASTSEYIAISDSNGYFNFTRIGIQTPTPGFDLSVSGTSYYSGTSTYKDFVDTIGKAEDPIIINSIDSTVDANLSDAFDVYVSGDYAYVAAQDADALVIIDVSDPTNPTIEGSIKDAGLLNGANSVKVSGDYAYVAAGTGNRISVVNISSSTNPFVVSTLNSGTYLAGAYSIDISGNYAFVASYSSDSLTVIDISDPVNPTIAGSVISGADLDSAIGVAVSGKYAYVASTLSGSLSVVNITDPQNPWVQGSVNTTTESNLAGAHRVSVSGKFAYVSSFSQNALVVVDISNPESPTVAGSVSSATDLDSPRTTSISGDYIYVACHDTNSVAVVDISSSTNPAIVGSVSSADDLDQIEGVFVSGRYAYTAAIGSDAFAVIDISGTKISNAEIGAIRTDNIQVMGSALFDQSLRVRGGLSVGSSGFLLSGDFGMSTATTTDSATNTLRFSHSTLFENSVTGSDLQAFMFNTKNTIGNTANLFSIRNNSTDRFVLTGQGNLGINSSTPYAALSVVKLSPSENQVIFAISTSTDGTIFTVDEDGDIFYDGTASSPSADYAEYFYTTDRDLKSGESVCVDITNDNAVKRCERGSDGNLMGIISTQPSIVGNSQEGYRNNPNYVVVGMLGQVPALVSAENGTIRPGDSLTSAETIPGYAMKANPGDPTVGVALEGIDNETGVIKVLISRRNKSLTVEAVEEEVSKRVADMEIEDEVAIMISDAVNNLDLDEDITEIVDQQIHSLDLNAAVSTIVEQKLTDINVGALVEDEMNNLDIVQKIEINIDDVQDVLNVAGFVEQAVSSTILHQQAVIDELVDRADATDIILSELSAKDAEFETYFYDIESEIASLQGEIAEVLQGSVESSFDLQVEKREVFNEDTVGQAKILTGSDKVQITFANIYEYQPVITITLRGDNALDTDFRYTVTDETIEGFTIKISEEQEKDVEFNWHAFAVDKGKIYVSDDTTEDIEIVVVEPAEQAEEAVLGESITSGSSPNPESFPVLEESVETESGSTETEEPIILDSENVLPLDSDTEAEDTADDEFVVENESVENEPTTEELEPELTEDSPLPTDPVVETETSPEPPSEEPEPASPSVESTSVVDAEPAPATEVAPTEDVI